MESMHPASGGPMPIVPTNAASYVDFWYGGARGGGGWWSSGRTHALHIEDIGGKRVMTELNTTLPMMTCAGCGRAFATEKQIERGRQSLPAAPDRSGGG